MIVDHLENNLSPEEKSKYVELGKGQKNKELRDENAEDDEGNSPNKKFATTTTEESDENSEKEVNENYAQEYLQYDTNKSIHILDNDCLTYIFQFLPIADKISVESGECFVKFVFDILYVQYICVFVVFNKINFVHSFTIIFSLYTLGKCNS